MQKDFDVELKGFTKQVERLTGEATWWGLESVGIKRAGLLAGVAGAALVVASPANAVWVAALSGFSGAANGFTASSAQEGFSKSVIASYIKPVIEEVGTAVSGFSLTKARQYMWDDADFDKFALAMEEQRTKVNAIKIAPVKLTQPITGSDVIIRKN